MKDILEAICKLPQLLKRAQHDAHVCVALFLHLQIIQCKLSLCKHQGCFYGVSCLAGPVWSALVAASCTKKAAWHDKGHLL